VIEKEDLAEVEDKTWYFGIYDGKGNSMLTEDNILEGEEDVPRLNSKEIAQTAYEKYQRDTRTRDHQRNRDQFWRDVVCALLSTGAHRTIYPSTILGEADLYLEEYDLRFNPNTGTKV
jgi:hypothetical protein